MCFYNGFLILVIRYCEFITPAAAIFQGTGVSDPGRPASPLVFHVD